MTRKGNLTLISGLNRVRVTVVISLLISNYIKIVEEHGKVFWCWEIQEGQVERIQGVGNKFGTMSNSSEVVQGVTKFLNHELDPKVSSWRKEFDGKLDSFLPSGFTSDDIIFKDICNLFNDLLACRILVEREESILKSIKNPNLFPILWYNTTNNGSYSIQAYCNYTGNIGVAARTTVEIEEFERNISSYIKDTVRNSSPNLDNWSSISFVDKKFERNISSTVPRY